METKSGLTFLEEKQVYVPSKFLEKEYQRKRGSPLSRQPFPDLSIDVSEAVAAFPEFAVNEKDFVLYDCYQSNGFASTSAHVRKTKKSDGQHYICGGVNAYFSNCDSVPREYIPKFKTILDEAGLVHLDIEPDKLRKKFETDDHFKIISSLRIEPDYEFALLRNQPRLDIRMFNNHAYADGPKRAFPSAEQIKKDALTVAKITQAMNETFINDFLHCEESYDDPRNDLSDFWASG